MLIASLFVVCWTLASGSPSSMNNVLPTYRKQRRLSQGDLAEAVGVTSQTINATECERYDLSLKLTFALADSFGCLVEDSFSPDSTTPD